jgi:hypothetical protein
MDTGDLWPADGLCGALGVSRGGFYAWLTRPRSRRSRSNEELGAKIRASFIASDRTGARRVWYDMLAEGIPCGCIGSSDRCDYRLSKPVRDQPMARSRLRYHHSALIKEKSRPA